VFYTVIAPAKTAIENKAAHITLVWPFNSIGNWPRSKTKSYLFEQGKSWNLENCLPNSQL